MFRAANSHTVISHLIRTVIYFCCIIAFIRPEAPVVCRNTLCCVYSSLLYLRLSPSISVCLRLSPSFSVCPRCLRLSPSFSICLRLSPSFSVFRLALQPVSAVVHIYLRRPNIKPFQLAHVTKKPRTLMACLHWHNVLLSTWLQTPTDLVLQSPLRTWWKQYWGNPWP